MTFHTAVTPLQGNDRGIAIQGVSAPAGQTVKQCGGFLREASGSPYGEDVLTVGGLLGSVPHPDATPLGNEVRLIFAVPQGEQVEALVWWED